MVDFVANAAQIQASTNMLRPIFWGFVLIVIICVLLIVDCMIAHTSTLHVILQLLQGVHQL